MESDHEHPALTEYKQELYHGRSIASELARRGYVVIVIDAFYWGERRMVLDDDPRSYREPSQMTKEDVAKFNRRSQQGEQLVARSLFTAGITWPGVALWDDLRTVDYLARAPRSILRGSRASGLSMGGYRSFLLAALEPRIKVARGRRLDDVVCGTDQKARGAHGRAVVPHRRPLPLSGSCRIWRR